MTRTRALRLVSRVAFASAVFLFSTASSCDAGDRALGGACPDGEVCDPATEEGLHFEGPVIGEGLFDSGEVKTLAVGGRQDVHLFDIDDVGHHVPLTLPFTATFDAGTIEATAGNVITLRGTAADDGFLRIQSADSGALFDRVRIAAAPIDEIRLAPSLVMLLDGASDSTLYAPGALGYVFLRGAGGTALVDEDAGITGLGISQRGWDRFEVGDLAPGIHQVSVDAGDLAQQALSLEIGHADSLAHLLGDEVMRGRDAFICFGARAGARPIHVAWQFEAVGGTAATSDFQGCTKIRAGTGNTVTVRALADGLSTEIALPVVDTSTKRTPSLERTRFTNTAGDRAAVR